MKDRLKRRERTKNIIYGGLEGSKKTEIHSRREMNTRKIQRARKSDRKRKGVGEGVRGEREQGKERRWC